VIRLPLSKGKVAILEDVDGRFAAFDWYATRRRNTFYAMRDTSAAEQAAGASRKIYLHRAVMGALPGVQVDHRDGDGLNCRRGNLRLATRQENGVNSRRRSDNGSGFKGVHWHRGAGRWRAQIRAGSRRWHLGYFATAEDAARAYDAAALELHGEFAKPNFPTNRKALGHCGCREPLAAAGRAKSQT
jgi:hypothetical protein